MWLYPDLVLKKGPGLTLTSCIWGRPRDQVLALVPLMGSLARDRNIFKAYDTVINENASGIISAFSGKCNKIVKQVACIYLRKFTLCFLD